MSRLVKAHNILAAICLLLHNLLLASTFATPEEAVNTYITAVKTGSGEHINMAFSSAASIQYYDGEGAFKNYTRSDFAELVNTGNQWDAKIEITDLKLTKHAANATVEFTWGENGERGYVDYLNLIYDGTSWRITDKVAQYVDR